jgi:hypothetical protein
MPSPSRWQHPQRRVLSFDGQANHLPQCEGAQKRIAFLEQEALKVDADYMKSFKV